MSTSSQIVFDSSCKDDIGLVKEILLRRLREEGDRWTQFGQLDAGFDRFVTFPSTAEKWRFDELLRQVIWEFIVAGLIAPGNGLHSSGANLPFFSVTAFGKKVLNASRAIPQDPDGMNDDPALSGAKVESIRLLPRRASRLNERYLEYLLVY